MYTIAVLLTCFNRKNKTLSALHDLYQAYDESGDSIKMQVYLTDDGSTDGTGDAVREEFPQTNILQGSGTMYWAGGMRNSWNEALKKGYDAYLLLNDDTNLEKDLFSKIIKTDAHCLEKYGTRGIYVGATAERRSKKPTYGGSIFDNRFLGTYSRCPVDEENPQECELGNANIMWVSKDVVDKIGILSKGYVHGMADFDYTMRAVKAKLPVLILPGISGYCINDHGNTYEKFMKLPLKERIKFLYHPIGLDFKSQLHHMKRHFPIRYPIFYLVGWIKVLFPKQYYNLLYVTRMK